MIDINNSLEIAQDRLLRAMIDPNQEFIHAGGVRRASDIDQIPPVQAKTISMDAILRQELAYVNTQTRYEFDFTSNAPRRTAALDNVRMGQNDIFGFYGIQVQLGYGANRVNRVYRSRGINAADESIYNANEWKVEFESSTPIFNLDPRFFKWVGQDPTTYDPWGGFQFIRGYRIVTGYLANFNVICDLPDLSGITLSSDLFISVTLHGAISRPK